MMRQRTRWMPLVAVLLFPMLGTTVGCPPPDGEPAIGVYQTSAAPPGRTAEIENDEVNDVHTIRISAGVTLAFACWDSCEWSCRNPSFEPDVEGIVEVRDLWTDYGNAWVIVGLAPGTTRLTVQDACSQQVYDVAVLDP